MKGWRHNRVDCEYEFAPERMLDDFFASKIFREWKKEMVYNLDNCFLYFISMRSPDGIDTYIESSDVSKLLAMIHADKRRYD